MGAGSNGDLGSHPSAEEDFDTTRRLDTKWTL